MNRKEFLGVLSAGAVAAACGSCMGGCKPLDNNVPSAPTNVDFTLNLGDAANAALRSNGGYVYKDGLIVARTSGGTYVAVSSICTHAGSTVYYDGVHSEFHCPSHGSNFGTNGAVIDGPASSPLARYNTALNGTSLRVYS